MARKSKKQNDNLALIITSVIFLALTIIAISKEGIVGQFLYNLAAFLFGHFSSTILLIIIIILFGNLFDKNKKIFSKRTNVACVLLIAVLVMYTGIPMIQDAKGLEIFNQYFKDILSYIKGDITTTHGGLLGSLLLSLSTILFDVIGTYIVIGALLTIVILLLIPFGVYVSIWHGIKEFFRLPEVVFNIDKEEKNLQKQEHQIPKSSIPKFEVDDAEIVPRTSSVFIDADHPVEEEKVEKIQTVSKEIPKIAESHESSPTMVVNKDENKTYVLPKVSLLDPVTNNKTGQNKNMTMANENAERLLQILKNFGVPSKLIATHIGPSVTKFEVKPDSNVKVNKILSIQDNIKMELAAKDIRIEAPIPGKNAVGIEIPNVEITPVKMRSIVGGMPTDKLLALALGMDLLGNPVFCNLDKMPHLLIAGATGSGKSVCMNAIITSLLLRTTPDQVKMLLIDPKKVEFTPYSHIPHLIAPVVNDSQKANNALKIIVKIMDERYDLFSKLQVRNIQTFNEKVVTDKESNIKPLPYIVVIIDELADLMQVAGKEVEGSIQRITQLARAAGIHLIVATQRPSTDVITGVIKSNIPSRISFSVSSGIDSRTILDQVGAERLLGNGDMLYSPIGSSSPTRLQGVYVSDDEVQKITEFCASQQSPQFDDNFIKTDTSEEEATMGFVDAASDPLYNEARSYVIQVKKASTSLLQRRFGVGYNRAAKIIDALEDAQVIGPQQGSKPREVLVTLEEE